MRSVQYQLFGDEPTPRLWPTMEVNRFGYIAERHGGSCTVVQLPVAPCSACVRTADDMVRSRFSR
jgi:hypothetical protein